MLLDDFIRVNEGSRLKMPTDIIEEENQYRLEIELAGYAKENLSVNLEKGYLTVGATTKPAEQVKYISRERYNRSISRNYYVGDYVEAKDIQAKYVDGILTILVPKYNENKVNQQYSVNID